MLNVEQIDTKSKKQRSRFINLPIMLLSWL